MVNQSWKGVRVELTKLIMFTVVEFLKLDLEGHRTRADHVLYHEVLQVDLISGLLDGVCVELGSVFAVLLTFGPCDNHLACFENKSGRSLRLFHSHDDGCESLWVVLGISALARDVLEIELTHKVGRADQVLELR